jgi:hypothetical protein
MRIAMFHFFFKKNFFKKKKSTKLLLILFALCITGASAFGQDGKTINTPPDILDSFIAIAIILFILSMINEKITQLIRKYSPFIKPEHKKRKNSIGNIWKNISKRQTGVNQELDRKIEREINSLSFMIGVLIALLFRVDLFKMFKAPDPRTVLFWSENVTYNLYEKIAFAFSITLTGFFLTFGSKFFHDLLDTLFQVKNLKRKLNEDATFEAENIEQFDEHLEKTSSSIVETAISQNTSLFEGDNLTMPPLQGKMYQNGRLVDSIDVHVKNKDRGKIPQFVIAKLSKGQPVRVPINVIYEVDIPKAQCMQGSTIANVNFQNFKGTICCKIKNDKNESLLITCSHVMTNGSRKNFFGQLTTSIEAFIDNNSDGKFTWALCTDQFDLALIDPENNSFDYKIQPKKPRSTVPSDILHTGVKIVRQNGIINEGTIVNYKSPRAIPISYSEGDFGVINLILLSKVTVDNDDVKYSTLTIEGDSGALVYDAQDRPIGMIIAGNTQFSYAIPIIDILDRLKATITT